MAAAEDMSEHAHSDTETGFGTGLRAKLGRPAEGEAESQSPAPSGDESFAPPLPQANGIPDADVEALRGELAPARAPERDQQTAVSEHEANPPRRLADQHLDTRGP